MCAWLEVFSDLSGTGFVSYVCLFVELSCSLLHLCPFLLASVLLRSPHDSLGTATSSPLPNPAPNLRSLLAFQPPCQTTATATSIHCQQTHLPLEVKARPRVHTLRDLGCAPSYVNDAWGWALQTTDGAWLGAWGLRGMGRGRGYFGG